MMNISVQTIWIAFVIALLLYSNFALMEKVMLEQVRQEILQHHYESLLYVCRRGVFDIKLD